MAGPLSPHAHGATRLSDGRDLGWASFGDPDGDTVFWFHGSPGARAQLPHDIEQYAVEHQLRIVGVERPGTGHSTPHRYSQIIDFVPDLVELADNIDADQFACVGLSGGGPFVLACAHELPDRMTTGVVLGGVGPTRGIDAVVSHTLALVPASVVLNATSKQLGNLTAGLIKRVKHLADPLVDVFFSLQPGDRSEFANRPLDKRQFTADLIDACERSGLESPFQDLVLFGRHWGFELARIRQPITFYGGSSDVIVPYVHAERQSKRVKNARLRTMEGRGHFAGYTSPDMVLADIREAWPQSSATTRRESAPSAKNSSRSKRSTTR